MTAVLRRALGGPGSLSGRGGADCGRPGPWRSGRERLRAVAGSHRGEERRSSLGSGSAGRLQVAGRSGSLRPTGATLAQNFVRFGLYRPLIPIPRLALRRSSLTCSVSFFRRCPSPWKRRNWVSRELPSRNRNLFLLV